MAAEFGPRHHREVFYVGGEWVQDAAGNHTLQGQMYVERLFATPSTSTPRPPPRDGSGSGSAPAEPVPETVPLVYIHGASRSGVDWLTKPDGKPGWAAFFLARGFDVYLVDQPFRGRSAWFPPPDSSSSNSNSSSEAEAQASGSKKLTVFPAETLEALFTACAAHGRWPQARLHSQWPGAGVRGDPVFDRFYASALPLVADSAVQERASQAACAALLDRIGRPAVLVGHSAGGAVAWLAADARPGLVKAIVNLEPAGPPFTKTGVSGFTGPDIPFGITNAPLTFDPPVADPAADLIRGAVLPAPAPGLVGCTVQAAQGAPGGGPRRLPNLRDVPVLVVTAQASYHAPYDWGTVAFLRQAGVDAEHLRLEDRGICGNGHMMFLEENSDQIAEEIWAWIEGGRRSGMDRWRAWAGPDWCDN